MTNTRSEPQFKYLCGTELKVKKWKDKVNPKADNTDASKAWYP